MSTVSLRTSFEAMRMMVDWTRRRPKRRQKIRCFLCGTLPDDHDKAMRMSLKNRSQLAVMLSSHVLSGANMIKAKADFEACAAIRRHMCNQHFADAAKQLAVELIALDIPFSSYGDGSARFGMTALVDPHDIPEQFLDRLNEVVKEFDKDLLVIARDVTKFVNEFLWLYLCQHRTCTGWDTISRLLPGIKRKESTRRGRKRPLYDENPECQSTVLPHSSWQLFSSKILEMVPPEEAAQEMFKSNGIKQEDESDYADYGASYTELAEPSCSSSTKVEPNCESISITPISASDLMLPLPRLAPTDPELLQYSFIVDGQALLKLFQFCPQCGRKLETDGAVRLVVDGSAPVVQYVCDRCSQEEPVIKTWRAQEDHTWSE